MAFFCCFSSATIQKNAGRCTKQEIECGTLVRPKRVRAANSKISLEIDQALGSRWECPFLHVNLKSTPIILCATDVQGEIPVVLKGFQRCDRSKKCICLIYFTNMLQWRMPLKLFNIASKCSEEQVQRRTNGLRQFEGLTLR